MSKVQFLLLDKNLITDTNISDKEYRIYTYLLYLYNADKKGSYPSLETISNALNISVTTVKKSIKNLVNLGYMKIEKEKCSKGYFNIYKGFKHLITGGKKRKSVKKKDNTPVDSNGEKPLDGQVHADELLESAAPELQANDLTSIDPKEIELVSNETGLEENQAKELLKIANTSRILEVYEYSKDRANELFSYMFSAIKNNWTIRKNCAPAQVIYANNENIEISFGNYTSNNSKRMANANKNIETGRGNYTSNNSKRMANAQVSEKIKREIEELEANISNGYVDLLGWY